MSDVRLTNEDIISSDSINGALSLVMSNLPIQNYGSLSISKVDIFNRTEDCLAIKDNLGKSINVKGYSVSHINLIDDETGVVRNLPILYLFNDEDTYYVTATTAIKRFGDLLRLFGLPDVWGVEGVNLIFDKNNKNGNTFYTVKIV